MGARLGRLRGWACLYIAQRRQFGSKFNLIWELLHIFRWGEASMEFWVKLSIIMYRSQLKCFSWSELNFLRWMNLQSRRSENYDSTKRPEQWNPSRYSSAVIGTEKYLMLNSVFRISSRTTDSIWLTIQNLFRMKLRTFSSNFNKTSKYHPQSLRS